MLRPKLIINVTDYFLILSAGVLLILELVAVFGEVELITDRMVRFSVFQLWIPVVLGAIGGHFFPFTRRFNNTKVFLVVLVSGIVGYLLWYVFAPEVYVITVIDMLAEFMWAFFLSGYVLGGLFFGRVMHEFEV